MGSGVRSCKPACRIPSPSERLHKRARWATSCAPDGPMNELLPVLLLGVIAVAFAAGSIAVSNLVGPRRPNPTKLGAYESGNQPLADVPGTRFSVKFYMVAMLFLIFDVEAVFVYPWAVVLRELGWAGLWQMVVFLGILGVAFVYEIGRGGLEWD